MTIPIRSNAPLLSVPPRSENNVTVSSTCAASPEENVISASLAAKISALASHYCGRSRSGPLAGQLAPASSLSPLAYNISDWMFQMAVTCAAGVFAELACGPEVAKLPCLKDCLAAIDRIQLLTRTMDMITYGGMAARQD